MPYRALTIDQLDLSPFNARTDKRALTPSAIEAMATSLAAKGQIMPIVVHPMKGRKDKFGVFAGQRRYRAFKALIEAGRLPRDHPIDAMVREAETEGDLIALSTAENAIRWDLYPYETYAALARSRKRGSSIEEIAGIMGQDIDWVRRGVRLGMLPEPIFRAYAEDEITLECAKAFAATEDAQLQLHVFLKFKEQPRHLRTATTVRQMLKVGDRELTRLLHFVGEETYRAEGGRFELDMFADEEEHRGIVTDEGLLRDLASAKLDDLRRRIRARVGRELRFGAEPPMNDFNMIDRSLQIVPPLSPLSAEDVARHEQLLAEQAKLEDCARDLLGDDGEPLPGSEPAFAEIDARYGPNEAEIARIEDSRPIALPAGDIFATIDIDDDGATEIRYWWKDHKARAAADKSASKPPARRQPHNSFSIDRILSDGEAIAAPIGEPWHARTIAEHRAKDSYGLTQDGVQSLRSLRRAILRGQLLEDGDAAGTVARDYFVWGQLRMVLTRTASAAIGMKSLIAPDRDTPEARELIEATTMCRYENALLELAEWDCFTEGDLATAFRAYRALDEAQKDEALTLLACIPLERSLNADGYRIPLHDAVAAETSIHGPSSLREFEAFTPTAPFFALFSKDHRLELALPFVDRATVATWAKRKSAEQTQFLARVFVDQTADLLDGTDRDAGNWVHPILQFGPQDPARSGGAAAMQEAAE
ncbi:ParB/RepB/Spo0J family partition protein [Sphingomonas hengshuiensis]|uniref:ParB-like N-terminal domain-containing protein n=1 Tax=Sphingomonas hengshuiensis TaxID=1609977 RepID=A0A7U4J9X2_9SPHN|nr:ParB/RepB/Spo0J family partition protein [Sphingomonas hengshuiensis]AJP72955.1 hypothetical protein TS85_15880 [Sphingomonas hengshuiensis]